MGRSTHSGRELCPSWVGRSEPPVPKLPSWDQSRARPHAGSPVHRGRNPPRSGQPRLRCLALEARTGRRPPSSELLLSLSDLFSPCPHLLMNETAVIVRTALRTGATLHYSLNGIAAA